MPILIRDYETRGVLDLEDVGAWRYATDANTSVLCCAYCVDDGEVKLWLPGNPCPQEWIAAAQDPSFPFAAFNDNFERQIEAHIMAPRFGWPVVLLTRHRCLQASSLSCALPGKLETVALALGLAQQKDMDGARNMMMLAKPRKRRKDEPPGVYWNDDPARYARLYSYCKQDVETERALFRRIAFLPPAEQSVWELDQAINDRGIFVDAPLANSAIRLAEILHAEIDAEISMITGGAVPSINCVQRLQAWLATRGCKFKDIGKKTLTSALARTNLDDIARRAIELRLDGAHASANKFKTMLAWRNGDSRIRGALKYHGASTGRWSSHGVQLQNLKRPVAEDLGAAIADVASGDIRHLRDTYTRPMSVLGDITRATIVAPPGHTLFAADFSGIEARVLAWLAGESSEIRQWAKFDETHAPEDEPYFINGALMKLGRDQGKTATLAFGFMGGVGAYRRLAPDDQSDEEIKRRQKAWRAAHPATTKFWGDINRAAISAVQKKGQKFRVNRAVVFQCGEDFLEMTLPSGRELAYPFPSLFCDPTGELAVVFKNSQAGQWVDCRKGKGAYGGVWTENAVQAVARDLLVAAMIRVERAGYPIVLHVHDEIVAEVPDELGREEEFLRLVVGVPDWAEGLPIAAKFRAGERFCKIKPGQDDSRSVMGGDHDVGIADDLPAREPHDPEPEIEAEIGDTCDAQLDTSDEWGDDDNTHEYADNTAEYTRKYNSDGYPNSEAEDSYGPHYIYLDKDGNFYSRATRMVKNGKKTFRQSIWNGHTWVPTAPNPKLPYRLPELIASRANDPVFICEGERDADSVAALGLVATTNPEGGRKGAWARELNKWFVDRTIYILEDNDSTGRAHANEVAAALKLIARENRIVSFKDVAKRGGDVSDWLAEGHTRQELLARATAGRVPGKGFELVCAEDVLPRNIDWIWRGHLALNMLELIAGAPGAGKSQIQDCCVACVTTGCAWPDGANGQGRRYVIMLTAEDTLDDTLIPRLIAAGADISRVRFLKSIRKDDKDRMFLLGEDLDALEDAIAEVGDVGLVTIDPITAYMGKLNSHMATDVRSQLGPLKDFSDRVGVCISAVTHPPKSAGPNALNHFLGSQAFIAAARLGHLCVPEFEGDAGAPRSTGRMLYTRAKHNPIKATTSLAYRIADATAGRDHRTGLVIETSKIVWEGPVEITADEAIAATSDRKKDSSGAVMFLMDMLSNGPVPKTMIDERAALHGFSEDQLKRAKAKTGIVAFKEEFQGPSFWCLPQHHHKGTEK